MDKKESKMSSVVKEELNKRDREIIEMYLMGWTCAFIGRKYGLSRQAVHYIVKKYFGSNYKEAHKGVIPKGRNNINRVG